MTHIFCEICKQTFEAKYPIVGDSVICPHCDAEGFGTYGGGDLYTIEWYEFDGPSSPASGPKVMNPSPLGSPPMFIEPKKDGEMYFPPTPQTHTAEELDNMTLVEFNPNDKVISHEERIMKRQTCVTCKHLSLFQPRINDLPWEPHPTIGKCGIINLNVSKDFYCDSWEHDVL